MIPQRDLSLLSNRLAELGGRRVPETVLERVIFPLQDRPILRGYEEYRDLPEDSAVRVYSLDEVAVEKTVALLDRARNEPRDFYDLWFLTVGGHVCMEDLLEDVVWKLEFRGLALGRVCREFEAKEARYKKLWQVRLATQVAALSEFEGVFRNVKRALRQAGITRR